METTIKFQDKNGAYVSCDNIQSETTTRSNKVSELKTYIKKRACSFFGYSMFCAVSGAVICVIVNSSNYDQSQNVGQRNITQVTHTSNYTSNYTDEKMAVDAIIGACIGAPFGILYTLLYDKLDNICCSNESKSQQHGIVSDTENINI